MDGVQYPIANGSVTVPVRYYSALLDNGYTDPRESPDGAWEDVQGDITQGLGSGALTYEVWRNTSLLLYHFQHNQSDSLHFKYQMKHAWDYATGIRPHLHFSPCVSPAANQVFAVKGEVAWAIVDEEVPAAAGWEPFAATFTVEPGMGFKKKVLALGEFVPPANAGPSSFFLMRLYRDAGATDTYTTSKVLGTSQANVALWSADVHYRKMRQGTTSEYA
jgi:hypothetical protein